MAFHEKPVCEAQAKLLLAPRLVDELFVPTANLQDTQSGHTQANEIQVMGSPKVQQAVTKKLGRRPADIGFTGVQGTDVVLVTAQSHSAKLAADTADAYASTYIQVRTNLAVEQLVEAATQVQAQIADLDNKIAGI